MRAGAGKRVAVADLVNEEGEAAGNAEGNGPGAVAPGDTAGDASAGELPGAFCGIEAAGLPSCRMACSTPGVRT
ncbi:protein of unknown function [Paraburkholderia kururiensis]